MAAITDLSDLVNRMTGGNNGTPENLGYFKHPSIAGTADTWTSLLTYSWWRYAGYPAAGAVPGAVAVPTNATAGAIPFTSPGGGRTKYLVGSAMASSYPEVNAWLLYDRLLHIGGLDGSSSSVQNVQSGSGVSLTRNTGGAGNQIWVEIYTVLGTTTRTLTITYTNQAGTGSRSATIAIGTTATLYANEENQVLMVQLQSGDSGVRSVESVQLSASTGAAGSFGITIANPLAWIQRGKAQSFVSGTPGLPLALGSDACLGIVGNVMSATESNLIGMFSFMEA